MAVFKCKMCGGELEIQKGMNIAECPYCGTKQTVPYLDDDKKLRLYNRANQYRLDNEFDKAYSAYETIISEKEDEAEAYWGLVLSEYGVEYVEDPATKKRIPTCHRTLVKSVTSNENFKLACQFAESESRMMYEDEAEELDSLQKKILNASAKEDPYDVFICYKETDDKGERTADSVLAQEIYNELTRSGLRVFFSRISLEDKLGKDYEPCIYAALTSAKVMLMVTTDSDHCNAVWVKNEWKRYIDFMKTDREKVLIPVYKDISPYTLPDEFAKLQAQDMSKLGAIQDLAHGVEKIVGKGNGSQGALGQREKDLLERLEKGEKRKKLITKLSLLFGITLIGVLFLAFSDFNTIPFFTYKGKDISVNSILHMTNNWIFNAFVAVITPLSVPAVLDVGILFNWLNGKKSKQALTTYISLFVTISALLVVLSFFWIKPTLFFWVVYAIVLEFAFMFTCITYWKEKKTMLKRIAAILIALVLALLCVFISPKQTNKRDTSCDQIVITIESLNLRAKPSVNSSKIGSVKEGEIYTVLEQKHDSKYTWYKIETNHKITGYVSAGELHEYVEFLPAGSGDAQSNARNESISQIKINTEHINIREKTSLKASMVGKVYQDEIYDVKSINFKEEYVWYGITTSFGTNGFVATKRNSDTIIELLPEGTSLAQSNGRNSKVLQIRVLQDFMNVRKDASENASIVTQAGKDDIFSVLDVVYELPHTWYKIKTNQGVEGYIASGGDHSNLEYLAPQGKPSIQSNGKDDSKSQYEVWGSQYLYKSASTDAQVIGMLYRGEVYNIIDTIENEDTWDTWYKIRTNRGVTGYVKR